MHRVKRVKCILKELCIDESTFHAEAVDWEYVKKHDECVTQRAVVCFEYKARGKHHCLINCAYDCIGLVPFKQTDAQIAQKQREKDVLFFVKDAS